MGVRGRQREREEGEGGEGGLAGRQVRGGGKVVGESQVSRDHATTVL